MASSERREIKAARGYIVKLRSMHPSEEVLRNLEAQERHLEERESELDRRERGRTLEHA